MALSDIHELCVSLQCANMTGVWGDLTSTAVILKTALNQWLSHLGSALFTPLRLCVIGVFVFVYVYAQQDRKENVHQL